MCINKLIKAKQYNYYTMYSFITGQAKLNPEHYLIKYVGSNHNATLCIT